MTGTELDARLWAAYERMVEAAERGDYVEANKWAAVRDRLRKDQHAPLAQVITGE